MTSKGARLYLPLRKQNGGPEAAVCNRFREAGDQRTERRLLCVTLTVTERVEVLPLASVAST